MKFCCRAFELASQNVGQRGLSVYTNESLESPIFFLGFRGITAGKEGVFSAVLWQSNVKHDPSLELTLAGEMAIMFCPWCGRRLTRIYKKTWKQLMGPDDMGYSRGT